MNVKLTIEYDGTYFHGWQRQLGVPTIQATIEDTLTSMLGHRVTLYGASRTDSGVHAHGQVANFFAETAVPAEKFRIILNTSLPQTIRILESKEMPLTFHSQKDALSKIYEYRILNRPYSSALDRRVYFYPKKLDWNEMKQSLPYFLGEKDFMAFKAAGAEVKSTIRKIYRFEIKQEGSDLYTFILEGNGFLKQMVRTMVGTVIGIGENRLKSESIENIFLSRNRSRAGRTLPPSGLHLVSVRYRSYEEARNSLI